MFDGFILEAVQLPKATWHRVAPMLARILAVVCPDLRGFGGSSKPDDAPSHAGPSKRAKARDRVAPMRRSASTASPS